MFSMPRVYRRGKRKIPEPPKQGPKAELQITVGHSNHCTIERLVVSELGRLALSIVTYDGLPVLCKVL